MTQMNKSLLPGALVLLAALGCTDDDDATTSVERVLAADATTVAGDLVPTDLFERDTTQDIDEAQAQASMPAAATMPLQEWETPELREYTRTNLFVPAGSEAGRMVIPVDTANGGNIMVTGLIKSTDPDEREALNQAVLADIRLLSPTGEVLNERAPRVIDEGADTETPVGEGAVDGASAGPVMVPADPESPMAAGAQPAAPPEYGMPFIQLGEDAPSGDYVLEWGARAGEIGVVVTLKMPNSPIELDLRASAHQVLLGGEGYVDVTLEDDGTGFDGEVTATLHHMAEEIGELPVTALGDGQYRVNALQALDVDSAPGVYNIYVRATGTHEGQKFDRYGWTGFHFAIPTARFVAAAEPTLVEANGLVTDVDVPVELEITGRDRYEVNGTLVWVDEDGVAHPVARAQTAAGLDEGNHTLTLRFDAGHVGLLNKDADFELRDLTIYSQTQSGTFHRLAGGLGLEVYVPASRTAEPEMTPALELLIHEGGYAL